MTRTILAAVVAAALSTPDVAGTTLFSDGGWTLIYAPESSMCVADLDTGGEGIIGIVGRGTGFALVLSPDDTPVGQNGDVSIGGIALIGTGIDGGISVPLSADSVRAMAVLGNRLGGTLPIRTAASSGHMPTPSARMVEGLIACAATASHASDPGA